MNTRMKGFTVVELVVVILLLILIVVMVLPTCVAVRRTPSSMTSHMRMYQIAFALSMYSESNGGWSPGISFKRKIFAPTVEERYQLLFEDDYLQPIDALSSRDDKEEWVSGEVTTDHYSFAMLDITNGDRKAMRALRWAQDLNDESPILGDRNIGENAEDQVQSIYERSKPGKWFGSVFYSDGHGDFVESHMIRTKYGRAEANESDNLFVEDFENDQSNIDTKLIYSGE
ncbi:hypothetical protein JD969_04665 [Planctomycetota bacterium]|nr:hypothetical protein JD969_04665 [Planctomycetota bacterium]